MRFHDSVLAMNFAQAGFFFIFFKSIFLRRCFNLVEYPITFQATNTVEISLLEPPRSTRFSLREKVGEGGDFSR